MEEAPGYVGATLVGLGYAVASVDYRLGALFPAATQDVRCAIQFLRDPTISSKYNLNTSKIGIVGTSAGGQLASLAAVTGTVSGFDSTDCKYSTQSASVQAAGIFYGVHDFATFKMPTTTTELSLVTTAFNDLFGGLLGTSPSVTSLSTMASPVNYVSGSSPPFFLANGDLDLTVTPSQSPEMANKLTSVGAHQTYVEIPNAPHAFSIFGATQPLGKLTTGGNAPAANYAPAQCSFVSFLKATLQN
jgi:acetyl esterase/lipase